MADRDIFMKVYVMVASVVSGYQSIRYFSSAKIYMIMR